DGLGAVEGDPPAGQVERAGGEAPQRPGGQGVGEVGAGRGRGPVVRHPLHPPGGGGQEILGRGQGQVGAGGHGQRQQPDEAHVVVQRQPAAQYVVGGVEGGRLGDGVEVGADGGVGQ